METRTLLLAAIGAALSAPWSGGPAAHGRAGRGSEDERPDPAQVRAAARDAGLDSLAAAGVPRPPNLGEFMIDTPIAQRAAVALGKALFWDMQLGSDGQACASCHFHAGADNRFKHQLDPGSRNKDPLEQTVFDRTGSGGAGGPNYALREEDFPFHLLADPGERNFAERVVLFDTDDVVSSQGVFRAVFAGVIPGAAGDLGAPLPDPVFRVGARNVRRVAARNAPSVINAVFNVANFWDGRAHNVFNGESVLGPLDEGAAIVMRENGSLVERQVRIPDSALASQAVGPPASDLEMSFFGRSFPEIARKLLGVRPLALQLVHPRDSVLGPWARSRLDEGKVAGEPGLETTYGRLIRLAFRPEYWAEPGEIGGYSQIELNFSLFLGLAIQAYESQLVSDRSPFDRFMEGDDGALTGAQLRGLVAFIRTPESEGPAFAPAIGIGNCASCHGGPALTDASVAGLAKGGGAPALIEPKPMAELVGGLLVEGEATAWLDVGFANIGVRPLDDDLGRGGSELGLPLSFSRQARARLPGAPDLPECGAGCPDGGRVAVDGAFKVPGLRNVELTGPYFHNGGQATLGQVVEFYRRQGDFGDVSVSYVDRDFARIKIGIADREALVEFLRSLTDERVRLEMGPFDHPQLFVPNGHPGDHRVLECVAGIQACDELIEVPPIGARGRLAAALEPLQPFLGLGSPGR